MTNSSYDGLPVRRYQQETTDGKFNVRKSADVFRTHTRVLARSGAGFYAADAEFGWLVGLTTNRLAVDAKPAESSLIEFEGIAPWD
jgi:hypothetical protein